MGLKNASEIKPELDLENLNKLKFECEKINSKGNIVSLLDSIGKDQTRIQKLLGTRDPLSHETEIYSLVDQIKTKAKIVEEIADPDWTAPSLDMEYTWKFWRSDFRPNPGTYFPGGFSLLDFEVEEVVLVGEKRQDLIPMVVFNQNGDAFEVKLKHKVSILTACQLASTLNIIIKTKFRSLRTIKYRWFNLVISKEALLKL